MTGRSSVVITFSWNTTGFATGNYTISAHASPVDGEIDFDDNNFTDGWLLVTIARDVNMQDIGAICDMFITTPSDPEWTPNRDISDDAVVNMRDIGIACNNFMKDP